MENEDENDDIHGNSKESKKKQHLYEIWDTDKEKTIKYGISGSKLNNNGSSKRANNQVNKLNFIAKFKRFIAKILERDIDGRAKALAREQEMTNEYKKNNDGELPEGQKKPN